MRSLLLLLLPVIAAAQLPYRQKQGDIDLIVVDWANHPFPEGNPLNPPTPPVRGIMLTACTQNPLTDEFRIAIAYKRPDATNGSYTETLTNLRPHNAGACASTFAHIERAAIQSVTVLERSTHTVTRFSADPKTE